MEKDFSLFVEAAKSSPDTGVTGGCRGNPTRSESFGQSDYGCDGLLNVAWPGVGPRRGSCVRRRRKTRAEEKDRLVTGVRAAAGGTQLRLCSERHRGDWRQLLPDRKKSGRRTGDPDPAQLLPGRKSREGSPPAPAATRSPSAERRRPREERETEPGAGSCAR